MLTVPVVAPAAMVIAAPLLRFTVTGACAAAVSLIRLALVEPALEVHPAGWVLVIEWAGDGADVLMTGPALLVYEGEWLND